MNHWNCARWQISWSVPLSFPCNFLLYFRLILILSITGTFFPFLLLPFIRVCNWLLLHLSSDSHFSCTVEASSFLFFLLLIILPFLLLFLLTPHYSTYPPTYPSKRMATSAYPPSSLLPSFSKSTFQDLLSSAFLRSQVSTLQT